jgi:GT2 family glycosyltransferase
MSAPLTVGLYVICHDRLDAARQAIGSAEGAGFDEVVVLDMASDPPLSEVRGAVSVRSDENVGVTAGRNHLAELARTDVLVFLDDDAVLRSPTVGPLAEAFGADPTLGAVAFRVTRADGSTASSEWPFRGRPRRVSEARDCAYFVGCGYAIRRVALEEAGGYDERFFYSTEEVDLSLTLFRRGWRLAYRPDLLVEHRPSPRGRQIGPQVPAFRMRNRLLMARKHLPMPAAVVHVAVWCARTVLEARSAGGLRDWLTACRDGLRLPTSRDPLSWKASMRVHRLGGRILW